jgi:hypothetical protein
MRALISSHDHDKDEIVLDFVFRGRSAAYKLQIFREPELGRGAAATIRAERARRGPLERFPEGPAGRG